MEKIPSKKLQFIKISSILNNKNSFFNMKIIQGKELSYNNINDMQAGCLLADEINEALCSYYKNTLILVG